MARQRPDWIEYLNSRQAGEAHTLRSFRTLFFRQCRVERMPHDSSKTEAAFGFLSSLESADYGFFGGYLIVSPLGRPLEFHCTSPVKPSRAQEILFGPTLYPYLLGDQIAAALLQAAKLSPRLIVTDQPAMLTARTRAKSPMTLLLPAGDTSLSMHDGRLSVGQYELQMPAGFEREENAVAELAGVLSQHVDLREPFGRIHEAIREAQRIGGRSAELHGQAA